MELEEFRHKGKRLNKDISGKILFVVGILLVGFSVFNLFEDPITNQYYKIRRAIMSSGTRENASYLTQKSNTTIDDGQVTSTAVVPDEGEIVYELFEQNVAENGEGFLPLNIEVSENTKPTAIETKEYDVVPVRLSIPAIELSADIINATNKEIIQGEKTYIQWLAPDDYVVGWHFDSAFLGVPGNTVLNGHHNVFGKVFENLDKLVSGDEIYLYGNDFHVYEYIVSNTMILPERDVSFEERLDNARWILPSDDERITLITCWPYFSNTHRLIIVAQPIGSEPIPITNERN